MEEKATIVRVPFFATICPHCKEDIFEDGYTNLYHYRHKFNGEKCPECGEIVRLGKVTNW